MKVIHNPSDKFFKTTLADKRVAKEFFQTHLPPDILQHLDLDSLQLEKHSFIDDAYKATEADVVYSVRQGKITTYLYVLCDHQSTVDRFMAFRMLVYKIRLMELHRKKHPNAPLPMVYSMVVYTGHAPWDAPLEISNLMEEPKTLAQQLLEKPYQLIDVCRIEDEAFQQHLWSGIVPFCLKYQQVRDFAQFLSVLFPWLEQLRQMAGEGLVKDVLYYVADGMDATDRSVFLDKVEQLSTELRGDAMTLAQQFEEIGLKKGIQQGMQQGIQQGEVMLLIRLLTTKFGTLPQTELEKIQRAEPKLLDIWGERILTANTLQEVLH